MSIKTRFRILHRKLSPWVLPLLLLTAITGLIYRIGRTWFAMTKDTGGKILHIHAGDWLGTNGAVMYTFATATALMLLILSGYWMWFTSPTPKAPARKWHRILAIALSLPLILTAVTSLAHQVGSKWFQFSPERLKLLLSLHQGSWLGPTARPFYILILGLGIIALSITGLRMLIPKNSRAPVNIA